MVHHGRSLEYFILPVETLTQCCWVAQCLKRRKSCCGTAFIHENRILLCIQEGHVLPWFLDAVVALVGNLRLLPFAACFGCNQDHTVSSTGTVDGRRSRILEDGD